MAPIPIRAHHGMCYAFFHGKGYSTGFVAHMEAVQQELAKDPQVRLLNEADRVCAGCPNLQNGICDTPEKVKTYEDRVLSLCGLAPGTVLSWSSFSRLVRARILEPGRREEICGDCQWSSICKIG